MPAAVIVAILIPSLVAIFLCLLARGKQWRAAEDKARAYRMAEHRMNARLLRLNM